MTDTPTEQSLYGEGGSSSRPYSQPTDNTEADLLHSSMREQPSLETSPETQHYTHQHTPHTAPHTHSTDHTQHYAHTALMAIMSVKRQSQQALTPTVTALRPVGHTELLTCNAIWDTPPTPEHQTLSTPISSDRGATKYTQTHNCTLLNTLTHQGTHTHIFIHTHTFPLTRVK